MIDIEGPARIQIAKWIIAEGGEMDHRVHSREIRDREIAYVFTNSGSVILIAIAAITEKVSINTRDLMTRRAQHIYHH